jgi:hypothetical protein
MKINKFKKFKKNKKKKKNAWWIYKIIKSKLLMKSINFNNLNILIKLEIKNRINLKIKVQSKIKFKRE